MSLQSIVNVHEHVLPTIMALNGGIPLCRYLLKSLDGAAADPTAHNLLIVPCQIANKPKVCLFMREGP